MLVVVLVEGVALRDARVPAHGTDVGHAVAELDKGAPLDGDVEVGDVVQHKAHKLLPLGLAQPPDERLRRERRARLERREPVLGKAEVEERRDGDERAAQLLLLLCEVGSAYVADGDLGSEFGEELEDLGRGVLGGGCTLASVLAFLRKKETGAPTRRAGVNVSSTSKRTMVFLMGRSASAG